MDKKFLAVRWTKIYSNENKFTSFSVERSRTSRRASVGKVSPMRLLKPSGSKVNPIGTKWNSSLPSYAKIPGSSNNRSSSASKH